MLTGRGHKALFKERLEYGDVTNLSVFQLNECSEGAANQFLRNVQSYFNRSRLFKPDIIYSLSLIQVVLVYTRTVIVDHIQGLELFVESLSAFFKLFFGQVALWLDKNLKC